MNFIYKYKGITLISLVITIIIILILSGITLSTVLGDNGILNQATNSKIASELSQYKEELEMYKAGKHIENSNFLNESLTVGKNNLFYNTQPENEIGNLRTIFPSITDSQKLMTSIQLNSNLTSIGLRNFL